MKKLTAKQRKLDMNKNNKIDARDFVLLRAKKKRKKKKKTVQYETYRLFTE